MNQNALCKNKQIRASHANKDGHSFICVAFFRELHSLEKHSDYNVTHIFTEFRNLISFLPASKL